MPVQYRLFALRVLKFNLASYYNSFSLETFYCRAFKHAPRHICYNYASIEHDEAASSRVDPSFEVVVIGFMRLRVPATSSAMGG